MLLAPRILAALAVVLLLAHAAAAGTDKDPEIVDDQNDQKVTANGSPTPVGTCAAAPPTGCIYIPADIWTAWIEETPNSLMVNINLAQAPPSTFGDISYGINFNAGTTLYVASATVHQVSPAGDGQTVPGGVATAAELGGTVLTLTVPKTNIPAALPGTNLTQIVAASLGTGGQSGQETVSDRAPSTAYGREFRMAPAASNTTGPGGNPPATGNTTTSHPPPITVGTPPPPGTTGQPSTGDDGTKTSPLGLHDALFAILTVAAFTRLRRPLL
ncbi:MAG: hypothetical protein V4510_01560 [bacterium]